MSDACKVETPILQDCGAEHKVACIRLDELEMLNYAIRRILLTIPTLLVAVLVFFVLRVVLDIVEIKLTAEGVWFLKKKSCVKKNDLA